MAYEIPGFSWTLVAGEDLDESQFCGIDVSGDGEAVLPVQGGRCVGFVQNKPLSGRTATIVSSGITKVLVGVTGIEAGDNVIVDDDGSVIQAASGNRGVGVALKTNAAGELGTVLLMLSNAAQPGS